MSPVKQRICSIHRTSQASHSVSVVCLCRSPMEFVLVILQVVWRCAPWIMVKCCKHFMTALKIFCWHLSLIMALVPRFMSPRARGMSAPSATRNLIVLLCDFESKSISTVKTGGNQFTDDGAPPLSWSWRVRTINSFIVYQTITTSVVVVSWTETVLSSSFHLIVSHWFLSRQSPPSNLRSFLH